LTSSDSLSVSSQTTTIVPAAHHLPPGLMRMLIAWLGMWPAPGVLRVAPSARRVVPGWDGQQHPLVGVIPGPVHGHGVALSVPPLRYLEVRQLMHAVASDGVLRDRGEFGRRLPAASACPITGTWRPSCGGP
jgi:hypothetical protein